MLLAERITAELDQEIDRKVEQVCNIRNSPGVIQVRGGAPAQAVPPSTIETLAMTVLEINAFRRGLDRAREIVAAELNAFVDPQSVGGGEEKLNDVKELY